MWDSLGVLALRGGSGIVRAGSKLGAHARTEPLLPFAGFTLGGPIVPRIETGIGGTVPALRAWWRELLVGAADLRDAGEVELRPFRVSLDDGRPALPGALTRLAAWVIVGAVALSAVVYAVGAVAAEVVQSFVE